MTTYGLATKTDLVEGFRALGKEGAIKLFGCSVPPPEELADYMLDVNLPLSVLCDGRPAVILWLHDFAPNSAWISYFFTHYGNKRKVLAAVSKVISTIVKLGITLRGEIRVSNRPARKIAEFCGFRVYRECGDLVYVQLGKEN